MPKITMEKANIRQNVKLYEDALKRHGQFCRWYRSSVCYCIDEMGRAEPSCKECKGRAYIYEPVSSIRRIDNGVGGGSVYIEAKGNIKSINRIFGNDNIDISYNNFSGNIIKLNSIIKSGKYWHCDYEEDLKESYSGKATYEGRGIIRVPIIGHSTLRGNFIGEIIEITSVINISRPIIDQKIEGIDWVQRESSFGTSNIQAVAYNGTNLWVAVGGSKIASSLDGISWIQRTSPESVTWNGVAHNQLNLWVTVGLSGKLATSSDGINWISRTSSFGTTDINDVAYDGSSYWVAVGANGKLATSTDGINWEQQTSSFGTNNIEGIAHNGLSGGSALWVAVGGLGDLATATDPTGTWIQRESYFGASTIYGIAYNGSDLWVAVGASGKLITSTDGINWSTKTSSFGTTYILNVAYGSALWVIVGTSGKLATSPDGVSWTQRDSSFDGVKIYGIAYNQSDMLIIVGLGGKIATSSTSSTERDNIMNVVSFWEDLILTDSYAEESDTITVVCKYIKPLEFLISGISQKQRYESSFVTAEADMQLTVPGYYYIGTGDIITQLKAEQIVSVAGNGNGEFHSLPFFHVKSIVTISDKNGKIKDAIIIRNNEIKWGARVPEKFSIVLTYNPSYSVLADLPQMRYAENKVLPRKVMLKQFDLYSRGNKRPSSIGTNQGEMTF